MKLHRFIMYLMRFITIPVWVILVLAFSSCTIHMTTYHEPRPYFTGTLPPPPMVTQKTPRPSSRHVWVSGFWHWSIKETRWLWFEGTWVIPPSRDRKWIPPTYGTSEGDTYYDPGFWKKEPHGSRKRLLERMARLPIERNPTKPDNVDDQKKDKTDKPVKVDEKKKDKTDKPDNVDEKQHPSPEDKSPQTLGPRPHGKKIPGINAPLHRPGKTGEINTPEKAEKAETP